jgi:hypothetical protein
MLLSGRRAIRRAGCPGSFFYPDANSGSQAAHHFALGMLHCPFFAHGMLNMIRRRSRLAPTAAFLSLLLTAPHALGATVFFDTDAFVMEVDGLPATTLNGVTVQATVVFTPEGQIAQFPFLGDLTLNSNDEVTALGSRPLSLFAGNDVNIASGTWVRPANFA